MQTFIEIIQCCLIVWAGLKILDLVMEIFSFLGGDGLSIYDCSWELVRPISFRYWHLFTVRILPGLIIWICLIIGSAWAVKEQLF